MVVTMRSCRPREWLITLGVTSLIGAAFLSLSYFNKSGDADSEPLASSSGITKRPIEVARSSMAECISSSLPEAGVKLDPLVKAINNCVGRFLNVYPSKLLKVHVGRFNEIKVFVNYADKTEACSFLTIGIGGDIKAEKEMKALHKDCFMVGLDPVLREGELFREVGTFINAGMADTSGTETMTVRLPNKQYAPRQAKVISPKDFMKEVAQKKAISSNFHFHFATIDIESYEYTLLQRLPTTWEDAGLKICQMDVELHRPGNKADFQPWFSALLRNISFVPVYAIGHIGAHCKVTLVSTDKHCERLFGLSSLVPKTKTD